MKESKEMMVTKTGPKTIFEVTMDELNQLRNANIQITGFNPMKNHNVCIALDDENAEKVRRFFSNPTP